MSDLRTQAIALEPYELVNLRELLEATSGTGASMDTGDWHGQLRHKVNAAMRTLERDWPHSIPAPNMKAEQMVERIRRPTTLRVGDVEDKPKRPPERGW